jgi:dTDP-4-dehydrorhamnose reductase
MVWLIGNKGMLGTEVEASLVKSGLEVVCSDRDVDITDLEAVESFVSGKNIEWIINCAAYTAVDKAEDEEGIAEKINALGPENLARAAKKIGAKLIHISTDYVFEGNDSKPRKEDDSVNPISAYGRTKLNGERNIENNMDEYFIIRTAWLYGPAGNNFVYTMLKLMNSKEQIAVVNDQKGSPTYAVDLADLITLIISSKSDNYGYYHFSNEGEITWYDFALKIKELGVAADFIPDKCAVNPCSSDQYPTKASRPAYSLLSKEKVKNKLGFSVPEWQESLSKYFDGLVKAEYTVE